KSSKKTSSKRKNLGSWSMTRSSGSDPPSKTDPAPFYVREVAQLSAVDGISAKKGQTAKESDPRPAAMSVLAFLLPGARTLGWNTNTSSGLTELDGRKALLVEITNPQRKPPRVAWD